MVALSPLAGAGWQFFDSNGVPLAGGKLFTYSAGTTTPRATFTSSSGATAHANPIILDSAGRVSSEVWLTSTAVYKFTLKNAADVEIWTKDDIAGNATTADLANTSSTATAGATLVGFLQVGAGAVGRTVESKLTEIVTPYDFGAVGNGIADDTAAVQAALGTSALQVYLAAGRFRLTSTVTSSVHNRTINGPGILTATSPVDVGLNVIGDRNTISINIDGNGNIATGLRIEDADMPIIEGGRYTNFYSATASAAAISLRRTQAGALIRGVTIDTVNAPGNGVADAEEFSRGIAIGLSGDPTGSILIDGCHISNIIGDEGDSIAAGSGGGGTYFRLDLTVQRCVIRGFNRRAVKTQGTNVRVIGNSISNDWTSSAQVPNAATVIDFVQGDHCIARDNDLYNCNFFTQIAVVAVDTEVSNNFLFSGNTFWNLSPNHSSTVVSFSPSGGSSITSGIGGVIRDNIQSGGVGRMVSVGKSDGTVITGNIAIPSVAAAWQPNTAYVVDDVVRNGNVNYICTTAGTSAASGGPTGIISPITDGTVIWADLSNRTISGSSTATKAIVLNNILIGNVRESFVALDGTNGIVMSNHVKSNTPVFANAPGNGNHLVLNNTADGTAAFTLNSNTLIGNRLGGNYSFATQTNFMPGPLTVTQSGGPATSLAGLQVVAGQIVFDVTPAAAGKIGWTAITSGVGGASTWAGSTAYDKDAFVINGGNVYRCTTAGTSAATGGPTGTGINIVDGTAVWSFVSAGPLVTWKQFGAIDA
jgi:hypothetical protein